MSRQIGQAETTADIFFLAAVPTRADATELGVTPGCGLLTDECGLEAAWFALRPKCTADIG
jgi:hypothetical protein